MNKCIETFAHYCDDEGIISEQYKEEIVEVWQAAWNAALEHASKICKERGPKEYPNRLIADGFAEEILKEKT